MEYRTHITVDIAAHGPAETAVEALGDELLTALERDAPACGPVVSGNIAERTLGVTIAFDSPTAQPDVILGRAMHTLAPPLREVLGTDPAVLRAEVELVDAERAAA